MMHNHPSRRPYRSCLAAVAGCLALALAALPAEAVPAQGPLKLKAGPGRFKILGAWDNQAVLDKETGLIWQREPATDDLSWSGAVQECLRLVVAGRMGFHMPTAEELTTLVDRNQADGIAAGHPFVLDTRIQTWTQTTYPGGDSLVYVVDFPIDTISLQQANKFDGASRNIWCVLGGSGSSFHTLP